MDSITLNAAVAAKLFREAAKMMEKLPAKFLVDVEMNFKEHGLSDGVLSLEALFHRKKAKEVYRDVG